MSVQTLIQIVPRYAEDWLPGAEFLESLLKEYFHAKRIRWLNIYSRPRHWDDEDDGFAPVAGTESSFQYVGHPALVRSEEDLGLQTALSVIEETPSACAIMGIKTGWSKLVWDDLRNLPTSLIDEGFCTNSPCLYIGSSSFPDRDHVNTAACTNFRLEVGGYGSPKDWDRYLQVVKENRHFVSLKEFVERESGLEYTFFISGTW